MKKSLFLQMKGKQLIYLFALSTISVAIEYREIARPSSPFEVANSDDTELMQLEASGSKSKKRDKIEQEKVKTLSQQVADGKYGLIQKELFSKPPKRPGVLSYESNSEVPNDTINNLGGLDKNEIWLAENHLLVLRGGSFPPYDDRKEHTDSIWPPLDTYKAPLHQVKIPPNPKVPPPFPVQLTKDGPVQILGTNFSRTLNETYQTTPYPLPPPEGFPPGQKIPTSYSNSADSPPGTAALPISVINQGEFIPGVSFPPSNLNESWPPFLSYLPPGAVILPPPGNQTDLYDDDDPSIYYPPPYSFFYPKDNSSAVPAGPLVPGIILPPPPNFFALLEETTTEPPTTIKHTPIQRQRKPITTTKPNKTMYKTTYLPAINNGVLTTEKPFKVYPVKDEYGMNEKRPTKVTTETPDVITIFQVRNRTYLPTKTNRPHFVRKNPQNNTILRPIKQKTTSPPKIYLLQNEIPEKPIIKTNPIVTTTHKPLKYYTTSNNLGAYSVSQDTEKNKYTTRVNKTTLKPTQYFYYGEEPESKPMTTPRIPIQQNYHAGASEGFYIPPKPSAPVRQRKPQYIYVTGRPYNTQKPRFRLIQQPIKPDSFRIHIAKLENEIHHYYTTTRTTKRPSPKPVYQYSFQAANYHSQNNLRPSFTDETHDNDYKSVPVYPPKYTVQIQQAIEIFPTQAPKYQENQQVYYQNNDQRTTKRPNTYYTTSKPNYHYEDVTKNPPYYRPVTTARPILEYSFEVTQNPVYQGFYTKPDEGFFDENTREYFTVFGKKLVASTTPLPDFVPSVTESYSSSSEHSLKFQKGSRYQQKPTSLESDTVVNYAIPKPNVEPHAEPLPIRTPNAGQGYPNVVRYSPRPPHYNRPSKINQQEPEIIKAIEVPVPAKETSDGSYISYELPGDDGARFYFLTPQFSQNEEDSKLFFANPNNKRIRRDDIKSDKER